ncbi:NADH-quinone oxidoreductase subunit NuoN [Mycobacteroides abscessus]|uniref:NADH-quinone oxidoreductase subunit NuoN n=1 Tax=Mycobacteroides abscessus TaxID=36809 RepID=UPI0009A8C1B8|nr:NADH-quinone oxidoreductase subunit NuoN [Mycobacteroides abscessus]SKG29354.1 NADH-quinone oxidoreductase subunit N [Mycobacteroides abscessus subsp. massiliense]SKH60355.1 NADH-quinone oxidoreductase subunit N [Mycobacteroides abscessus subsp. massiliense]SKH72163.1 NADH-quinone oxidoreductase subunit N [Mycobacteroides abscessus subsp. massiliense]SKI41201.1 NADH-quinone oxidoreductase subunit N [Mycobacteroides abscessus subsp. massiliense]SKI81816.1 NADH-quinone oxidoreductase subunit 
MTDIGILPAPAIAYGALSPMLIMFGVAVVSVLVEAFVPRGHRLRTQLALATVGILGAFVAVVALGGSHQVVMNGAVAIDGPTLYLQGLILVASGLALVVMAQRRTVAAVPSAVGLGAGGGLDSFAAQASSVPGSEPERVLNRTGITQTEIFPLTLLAIAGMMLFPACNDLLTMFVALEVFSLPLYVMCALARRRRLLSQESALKYFLLGAFSSAFFLFGSAFVYGYAGTVELDAVARAVNADAGERSFLLLGVAMLSVGLLFKVGAVPFHFWVPDVYQGAPTPVTAFMAATTKIAAFGALLRVLYVALPGITTDWRPVLWAVAIATMLIGSIGAVTQTDVKRMLAYSAVAHTGFLLTGVAAANERGISSTLFYLAAYGFSTVGAFTIAGLVRSGNADDGADGDYKDDDEVTDLRRWAGVGRRAPVLGIVFALFLLAFAGIPLTSGFVSKFAVFEAAAAGGAMPLIVVGVMCSAIAAYFYVRVIVVMFFADPLEDSGVLRIPGPAVTVSIAVSALITVLLGVAPQPLLDLVENLADFAT